MPACCSRKTKATALRAPWPTVWIRGTSGGRGGFLGLLGFLLRALGFLVAGGGRLVLRAVEQRDERERRVVALAEPHLQDAQVAAVALGEARAEIVEQLRHDAAVAQAVESEAPVGERRLLAERDHRLGDAPQL